MKGVAQIADADPLARWGPIHGAALAPYVEDLIDRLAQLPNEELAEVERAMSAARWVLALSPDEPAARVIWVDSAGREVRAEFTDGKLTQLEAGRIVRATLVPFKSVSAAARIWAENRTAAMIAKTDEAAPARAASDGSYPEPE